MGGLMFMNPDPVMGVHISEAQFLVPDCGNKVDYIVDFIPPARQAT
jgi:hypothetical protein